MKKDKIFLVEFPDLPGCLTDGTDMEDARAMAVEALSGYLMSVIEGENPETSNPTLKTLKRLEKVFGEELVGV